MSEDQIDQFDRLLSNDGPAALVFHRALLSVEGKDAWIFPPTFAKSEAADEEGAVGRCGDAFGEDAGADHDLGRLGEGGDGEKRGKAGAGEAAGGFLGQ